MKAIRWFILTSAILTACTAATIPPSTSTLISTSTATIAVKTLTPTQVEPTPTEEIVEPSPTPTAEPTLTTLPEPTLTPEPTEDPRNELIEQVLAKEIGPDWNSFLEWNGSLQNYFIKMVSDGEYLDYIDNPLNIPISDNPDENPEMLVGTKAYYLDLNGEKQEVILPIVMRLTDERLYRFGPYRNNIVNWSEEEILDNVPDEELQLLHPGAVGGLKGEIIKALYVPTENTIAYYRGFGMNPPGDPYNIIDELNVIYQETHKEELDEFITNGKPPSSGIFFPSTQMGMLAEYGVASLP